MKDILIHFDLGKMNYILALVLFVRCCHCQQFPNGQTQSSQYEMLMNHLSNQLGLPQQAPSAFMIVGATRNPQSTEYISFRRVLTQVNSQLYVDYGSYIPELSGIYLFCLTIALPHGNVSRLDVAFHVNDAIVRTFSVDRTSPVTTHNVILYMIPGQAVFLKIIDGFPDNETIDEFSFSGVLISSYNSFGVSSGFSGLNPGNVFPHPGSLAVSPSPAAATGPFASLGQPTGLRKGKYPWEREGVPFKKVKAPFPWQKGGR